MPVAKPPWLSERIPQAMHPMQGTRVGAPHTRMLHPVKRLDLPMKFS